MSLPNTEICSVIVNMRRSLCCPKFVPDVLLGRVLSWTITYVHEAKLIRRNILQVGIKTSIG